MDRAALNKLNKSYRQSPAPYLLALRALEQLGPQSCLSTNSRARKRFVKRGRELRAAALFCYGMSCRIGQRVDFVPIEDADYDFVATWASDENQHLAPVQLKELVPDRLNPAASLQGLLDNLGNKYCAPGDLTVAIYVNRNGRLDLKSLQVPRQFAALWIFGATSAADNARWCLYGNLVEAPEITRFGYPATSKHIG